MNMSKRFRCFMFAAALLLSVGSTEGFAVPNETNTGPVTDVAEFTPYTGRTTIVEDGTVLENFTFEGILRINANNVTIRNCVMSGVGTYAIHIYDGTTGTVIEDCILENMQSAAILGSNFIASRLEIRNSGSDAIKAFHNFTIEDSWFHHLGFLEGAHADGVQMVQGSNGVIRGNHFDMAYDEEGYRNSQCIILGTNDGVIDNILIEGNWLNGGNYCLVVKDKGNGWGDPTNITIINNQFGPDYQFGPQSVHVESLIEYGNDYEVSPFTGIMITPTPEESPSPSPVVEPVVVEVIVVEEPEPETINKSFSITVSCTATGLASDPVIACTSG